MELTIRNATVQDLEAIMRLWRELADYHADLDPRYRLVETAEARAREFISSSMTNPSWRFLVAEQGREVIGFISGFIREDPTTIANRYGYIEDAVVTTRLRRSGAGEALCRAIESWFKERGLKTVQLNAAAMNPVSRAFWKKMGYEDWSVRMRKDTK